MKRILDSVIKVLVVDDSAFMRKIITDILNSDENIQVLDTARNGFEALEKFRALKPDIITLDVEMPVMNGLDCLKELLKYKFVPVIMFSSLTCEGAEATIQALTVGAVDFVTKPTNIFGLAGEEKKQELIEKIKIARTILKADRVAFKELPKEVLIKPKNSDIKKSNDINKIIAIGSSTGGPRALQDVISKLPGDIPASILIVQHMPPGFTDSLAKRLNGMSELTVKEAEQDEIVRAGYAYIAPGDYHMRVEKLRDSIKIKLSQDIAVGGHRPAINVLMDSLSATGLTNIIAVIMTGMGADGSEGIKKIKLNNKGHIIAQDEESCVVYGMPKVAIQTGLVDDIVPLSKISKRILSIMGVQK
jgi:two-component system, chemotaxis family, protein-glutamate methylesterase/glutaminase